MKVAIFTGIINIQKENPDVRKQYIIERIKYLNQIDIQLNIVTPKVKEFTIQPTKNIKYHMYKVARIKHLKLISATIFPVSKLIKINCEIIHCYTYQAAILAWLINHVRKQKYFIIFEPMGLAYEESTLDEKSSAKVKLLGPFIKLTEKLTFKKADIVVVYTNALKNYVSQKFDIGLEKIYIIPHGVNLSTQHIHDKSKKLLLIKVLNIPEKNKIVLYAGSLSELHGTPFLIEIIDYLNKKRQDISFLILGKGVLEKKLKEWIKKKKLMNVHLLGFVPSEEIEIYYNLADVLLIPHARCMQTELDQPTKLFEYLASGRPIVSFNLKAIAEVVGNNAILVEPDNSQAFADGILTLLSNEDLGIKLGEKGRLIVQDYSWEISAEKQYNLYEYLHKMYIKIK